MELSELEAAVRSLTARVESLEAENASLRATAAAASAPVVSSRREWLARGAAVAAGAVAGGVTLAQPAAAATGPINMNVANDANTSTRLQTDLAVGGNAVFQSWNLNTVVGGGVQGFGYEFGVIGNSPIGDAVRGVAPSGVGGAFDGGDADLRLGGTRSVAPTADAISHARGQIMFVEGLSNTGEFWLCAKTGIPGTWRRFGGYNVQGGLTMAPSPVRVYDSRPGKQPLLGSKTPLAVNGDRTVDLTVNSSGVPAEATAVLINLTAVAPNGSGWLSVRSSSAVAYAGTSNLNFSSGQTIANMVAATCTSGSIAVRLGAGTATACDVIVDVLGYYR